MTAVSEIIMGKTKLCPLMKKTQIFQKNTQKPRRDLKNPDLVGKT